MSRLIIYLLLCLFCICCSAENKKTSRVPDIQAKFLNGDSTNLKTIAENKLTLVNVWGIFCGPCIQELDLLHNVYDKYKVRKDFEFITLAMDSEKEFHQFLNPADTSVYRKMFIHSGLKRFYLPTLTCLQNGYSKLYGGYAIVQDSTECRAIQKQIQSTAIPTTLIYNKTGELVFKQIGSFENEQELTHKIDSLLVVEKTM
jgi:thiol-disulfide isomerase/thioredoxin